MSEKLYYQSAYQREFDAAVLNCEEGKNGWIVELDATAFYPEGGGQPSDTGVMTAGEQTVSVHEVHEKDGRILHYVSTPIEAGTQVHGVIDWERRFDHMQQHSGEHIVSGMICSAFQCDNVGFHMGKDIVTIDYNAEISMEMLKAVETKANQYIWENHAFVEMWPTPEELKELDYRSKKELSGEVRITSFPGADMCACCGTHVAYSGEVGLVKFLSAQKFTKGTRIELLCGKRALDFLSMNFEQNSIIGKEMAASLDSTAAVYAKHKEELIAAKIRISELEKQVFESVAESYRGAGNVLRFEEGLSPDSVRKLCVLIGNVCGGRAAVFSAGETAGAGFKYAVAQPDADLKEFVKELNAALNGRGGGKGGFVQGSAMTDRKAISRFFEEHE